MVAFVVIIFLSTTKATIAITPIKQEVVAEKIFSFGSAASDLVKVATYEHLNANVVSTAIDETKTMKVSKGEPREVIGTAAGIVTIYNNRSKSQPLVATTRLLSSGGILFRLKQNVFIPAGGQIEAEVYADQAGEQGDIGPDTFIIPGLPLLLQKEVYAKSTVSMKGGKILVSTLTQEELDAAGVTFEEEILEQTKEDLRAQKGDFDAEWFSVEIKEKKSDTLPGQEASEFTMTLQAEVIGIFYKQADLKRSMETALYEELSKGTMLASADYENMSFMLGKIDTQASYAEAQVKVTGWNIPSLTHPELDKALFVGKSKEEIRQYFLSHKLAEQVEITFFPPWIRSTPRVKDHIHVVINNP